MSIEDKMIRRIVELKERAERAEKELERVQRRNAAMRDFLVYLKQYTDGNGIPEEMDSMEMVLSDNAGSSFVSRDEQADARSDRQELERMRSAMGLKNKSIVEMCDQDDKVFSELEAAEQHVKILREQIAQFTADVQPLIEVVAIMADACGPWDRVTMERIGKAALEHARGKGWCK